MTNWRTGVALAVGLALPSAAMGQSFGTDGHALIERRVSLGLTIPIGGNRAASPPQLELRASTVGQPSHRDLALRGQRVASALYRSDRDSRVGLTLERSPRLTLAGQALPASERKLGLSTIGWVAIGVGAAAIVGGLLFIDAVNDASD